MESKCIRIVFMGTPAFAVASLQALVEQDYDVCAVITAPDRPAGRGRKLKSPEVKDYAISKSIPVLQPENLKDPAFLEELSAFKATLFIVVAFRMLPEEVWAMPALGTFNLHASLLPQYRGAAPINRTIMNGETLGGVSTFFLRHKIDTGNIILREEITIGSNETAGDYHDNLLALGARLVLKTVEAIKNGNAETIDQNELLGKGEILKTAPKIFKKDCLIDWSNTASHIFNQIRGLSPYPGAYTSLALKNGNEIQIKVYKSTVLNCDCNAEPGSIMTDGKTYLNICCADACISLLELQQSGKKRMKVSDFLAGLNTSMLNQRL